MAAPKRRSAMSIYWISPQGQRCSLLPMRDSHGLLEVDIIDSQVLMHGRNCMQSMWTKNRAEAEKTGLAEVEISLPLSQCEIHWHILERKETEEVERSIYYKD